MASGARSSSFERFLSRGTKKTHSGRGACSWVGAREAESTVAILAQGTHWALAAKAGLLQNGIRVGGEERRHGFKSPGTSCEEKDGCREEEGKATRLLGKRRVPMNAFWTRRNCGVEGGAYRLQAGFISIPSRPFGYDQV